MPIQRGISHKRARSFLSQLFVKGFIFVVLICLIFWLVENSWVLPTFACAYYTGACVLLVALRYQMKGFREHTILSQIGKNLIFPFGGLLTCIYQWAKDENDNWADHDTKRYFLIYKAATCVILMLLGIFFYLSYKQQIKYTVKYASIEEAQRREQRLKYLELGDLEDEKQTEGVSSLLNVALSDSLTETSDSDGLLALETEETKGDSGCCHWISTHSEEIAMGAIYIFLMSCAVGGLELYADSQSRVYQKEEIFMYYASGVLGVQFIIFSGLTVVLNSNTAGWTYMAGIHLLPTIVPQMNEHGSDFDFQKGVIPSNVPTGCAFCVAMCVLFWGLLACMLPDVDFLLGDAQMVCGVLAICLVVCMFAVCAYLKSLSLNYALAANYHHIATRPICMTPVSDVDRIVGEVLEAFAQKNYPEEDLVSEHIIKCQLLFLPAAGEDLSTSI